MKKAFLSLLLVLGIIIGFVGINSKKVNALDDSKEALTVLDVNYSESYAGWAGQCVQVNLGSASGNGDWYQFDKSLVSYTDKDGADQLSYLDSQGNYLIFNRSQSRAAEQGDILTIKAGFVWGNYEAKEDIVYEYSTVGQPWTKVVVRKALSVVDVNYTDNYAGFAGNCTSVNFGVASGLGDWAQVDSTLVSYTDKDGVNKLEFLDSQGNYLLFNRTKTAAAQGDIITIKKGFVWGEYEAKEDIVYEYSTVGQPWTVYVEKAPEKAALTVADVNYTDNYAGFAGNCTSVNFGVASGLGDWAQIDQTYVSYTDKDGVNKLEFLDSQGNYLLFNRAKTAAAQGDIITIKKGFVWGEYEAKEDIVYEYSTVGQPWTVYVPEKPAFSIVSVNYSADWHGTLLQISEFTGASTPWGVGPDMDHLIYRDSQGTVKATEPVLYDHHIFILSFEPIIGDTVEVKAGTVINGYELKEDVKYIFVSPTAPWVVYSEDYAVTEVTVAESLTTRVDATQQIEVTLNENAAATPVFESANTEIATVDANGVVKGIAVGTTTITVKAGSITKTVNVTVKEQAQLEAVVADTIYKVYVVKGTEFALPENFTAKAKYSDNGETVYGEAFALTADNCTYDAVNTTTVGTQNVTLKIAYNEEVYNIEVAVEVYEIDEMEVKEIAIVEWFAFNVFVQFPNSTTNNANLTNSSMYPDATKYTYTRADGTVVSCGTYNLGGGNVVILPGFIDSDISLENFSSEKYYQIGDTITLQAGFGGYLWTGDMAPTETDNGAIAPGTGMAIKECELTKQLVYKFDGSTWGIYIEYTDFEVAKEEVELVIGKTVSCGATRTPAEATVGEFTYTSSDETVAKVNARGVISGIAAGTATITVTLNGGEAGEITKTITVTVVDAVSKVEVADAEVIKIAAGAELDLTNVDVTVTYASGKTETVKIGNATVTGFDANETDEQTVVVKVTVGETEYTVQVKVQVESGNTPSGTTAPAGTTTAGGNDPIEDVKKGCGNSIIASFGLVACLSACVVVLKKKKENE